MKAFRLTLPAGMFIMVRPIDTSYATTGAKCVLVVGRNDGAEFDKEDVQLLSAYLLQTIDEVTKAHADAPAAPGGLHVQDPFTPDEADMAALEQSAAEPGCSVPGCTAPKGHDHDDRAVIVPGFKPASEESSLAKKPLTHEMALESKTGTACFYCHELDPTPEHLEKCRALDAATKQVQGDTKERPS